MKALFRGIILSTLAMPALAQPLQTQSLRVTGAMGFAGEWELTATLVENASGRTKEYAGPLTMTHVGLCTQDGPEKKTGEMRLQLSPWSRVNVSLSAPGLDCTYSGRMSNDAGTMTCSDRQVIPLKLSVK